MDPSSSAFQRSTPCPSSALAPRGNSGVTRPPRPTGPAPAKKKQRKFVAPHSRPTTPPSRSSQQRLLPAAAANNASSMQHHQQAPTTGAGIPDDPTHVMIFTEPPPYNLSLSRPSLGATTAWDVRSSASSPTLGYENDYFSSTPMPVFDWTPDYSANDPLHSSSQPLMNLLGQDADADLQLLMSSDATPSSGGKGATKRGGNYTHNEDNLLCDSWINISNDPVVGADQSGKSYWERIAAEFHKNKTFESDRTTNSLEQRFQTTILRECMRFHGYFEEVERRRPSGVPHEEYIMEAQASQKGKSKKINLNLPAESQQGDEGGQDGIQGQEKAVRPPGRKKSKEKLKRSDDGDDEYKNLMKDLLAMKAEKLAMRKEMRNKDMMAEEQARKNKDIEDSRRRQIEERRLELEHQRLLWEQEREIMFCDVSKMDEHQRSYVMMKRADIAKTALLSASGGGASIGESACIGETIL